MHPKFEGLTTDFTFQWPGLQRSLICGRGNSVTEGVSLRKYS